MFDEDFEKDIENKEFGIWLQNGIDRGWVTEPFCFTHDGDPFLSEEEAQEWEEGGDPCSYVIKLIEQ